MRKRKDIRVLHVGFEITTKQQFRNEVASMKEENFAYAGHGRPGAILPFGLNQAKVTGSELAEDLQQNRALKSSCFLACYSASFVSELANATQRPASGVRGLMEFKTRHEYDLSDFKNHKLFLNVLNANEGEKGVPDYVTQEPEPQISTTPVVQ